MNKPTLDNTMWTIITAGGEGLRLRPFTEERSKPLVPLFNNFPITEFVLYTLAYELGLRNFIFGTRGIKHYQNVHTYYQGGSGWTGKLNLSPQVNFEYQNPNYPDKGSADCVAFNINNFKINSPLLIVPCDNLFFAEDIQDLISFGQNSPFPVVVGLKQVQDARFLGLVHMSGAVQNKIDSFQEKPGGTLPIEGLVNTAIYFIKPEVFQYLKGDFGKDTLPKLAEKGLLAGYIFEKPWYELGNPKQHLSNALEILKNPSPSVENFLTRLHTKVESKNAVVWIRGKGSFSKDAATKIEKRIKLDKIKVEGHVVIGKDCQIENDVILNSCSIGDLCHLNSGVSIAESNIFDAWEIGMNATILSSALGRGGKIGEENSITSSTLGDNITIGKNCQLKNVTVPNHHNISDNEELG